MSIADNIAVVRERIDRACERVGRDPGGVTLVGAVKQASPAAVLEAGRAGLRDIGDNRVQEARARSAALGSAAASFRWHLIGHLQTNKAREAATLFGMIHSIDSLRLAEALDRRTAGKLQILLEVNVGAEVSKSGFAPGQVSDAVSSVGRLDRLDLIGLMTVAPAVQAAELVRPGVRQLRLLAEANGLRDLSMGMSDDFEVAVEEGATMVRIGRAIFGERQL